MVYSLSFVEPPGCPLTYLWPRSHNRLAAMDTRLVDLTLQYYATVEAERDLAAGGATHCLLIVYQYTRTHPPHPTP